MHPIDVVWIMLTGGFAWVATWQVKAFALSRGRLDLPNARSSHTIPTPRGGGIAIVMAVAFGLTMACLSSGIATEVAVALGAGGLAVAAIGYVDDLRSVAALPRLGVHFVCALFTVLLLFDVPGAEPIVTGWPPWVAMTTLVLGIVWSINLFNFMDGIDGIAASEAAFVAFASAWLMPEEGPTAMRTLASLTGAASLGFLVWNWPPARIFMGDVGSGFLGYWLAALGVALHVTGALDLWTSVTLGSVFIADASATLLRRVVRGERWYEAHRSHAYQHLAQRWESHRKVTVLVWIVNLGVVLPLAYASTAWPDSAAPLAGGTVVVLAAVSLALGAGRPSA